MARYRVSLPARADIASILIASDENWGSEGRRRYSALLVAALRQAAADPEGRMTRDCGRNGSPTFRGLRSSGRRCRCAAAPPRAEGRWRRRPSAHFVRATRDPQGDVLPGARFELRDVLQRDRDEAARVRERRAAATIATHVFGSADVPEAAAESPSTKAAMTPIIGSH